jgi:hypothetical protein
MSGQKKIVSNQIPMRQNGLNSQSVNYKQQVSRNPLGSEKKRVQMHVPEEDIEVDLEGEFE